MRQKTIALLSLSMMARPSDLAPAMGFHSVKSLCGIKNDSDRHGFEIKIDKASNPKVDPVACLKNYLDGTAGYTSNTHGPVFLSCTPPYLPISARVIAQCLTDTGLEGLGFTPRSFRPSAATAAVASGLDPNTTQQIGRWKTKEVFFECYVYSITKRDFTDKILDSNIRINLPCCNGKYLLSISCIVPLKCSITIHYYYSPIFL